MNVRYLISLLLFSVCPNLSAYADDAGADTLSSPDIATLTTKISLPDTMKQAARLSASHLGVSILANPGWLVKYDPVYQRGRSNISLGADLMYRAVPSDGDAFAYDYNYPTLSLGIRYGLNHGSTMHRVPGPDWALIEEVDYISRIGNTLSFIGTFSRPLLRYRRFELDAALSMGVSYSHSKYNIRDAIDNDIVGSRWLIHFGAGVHVNYHFASHWSVKAGADYWHVSNGAMNRPNKGANYFGPSVALCYWLDDEEEGFRRLPGGLLNPHYNRSAEDAALQSSVFTPFTYLRFTVGIGMKALDEEWKYTQFHLPVDHKDYRKEHFHHYVCYSLNADFMYRYARRWASGIGIDLFYATYADATHDINAALGKHAHTSPVSVAIAGKHEVFYHNFSVPVSLGVYLYRAMGGMAKEFEKPYYETVGLHYTFPRLGHLRFGVNVKAHLFKADYTELALSLPIVL